MRVRRGRSIVTALCTSLVAISPAVITGCGLTQFEGDVPEAAKALAHTNGLPYFFVLSMDIEEDLEIDWPTE